MTAASWQRRFRARLAAGVLCVAAQPGQDPATGMVEGRVLGPLGEPMVGIEVRVAIWPELDTAIARTRTDGDGMFVLGRVPHGLVSVLAAAPGHTEAWGNASLSAERPADAVHLRLWDAITIRGQVVGDDGRPVAGASVLGTKDFTWFDCGFRSPESRTDAEGRFTLAGVPIGDCVVRAWAGGFVMTEHRLVALADAEVQVRLTAGPGVRLSVRATELPAATTPQRAVRIHATRNGSGFNLPSAIENASLDAGGTLELGGLPEAEWNVELDVPGFVFDPRSARTKPGETRYELIFRATRVGALQVRGTLRDAGGNPLAGQTLMCRTRRSQSMNGGTPARCVTGADGRFTLVAPLVAGEPYSLHLVGSEWVLRQTKAEGHMGTWDKRYLVRYEDDADPQRELALVAVPATFVSGRLVDSEGNPMPFLWTELQEHLGSAGVPSWVAIAYATSRRDGAIAFPGVHALDADVRIHAAGKGGAGESEPFRLRAGQRHEIEVMVARPGAVTGRATDRQGRPLAGLRVSLRNFEVETGEQVDGSWTNVPTDRDGRFTFVGVAPGGHRVDIDRHEGRKGESAVFAVRPGGSERVDLVVEK